MVTESSRRTVASTPFSRLGIGSSGRFAFYAVLVVLSILFTIPFIWTVLTALKAPYEIFVFPPIFVVIRMSVK